MAEAAVADSVDRVVAALREAGRAEDTVRRYRAVLDRFVAFLTGRGVDTAGEQVCIDFIANQTGIRLGSLREPVTDRAVQAVRRPVVLMADVLAGRAADVDRTVVPAKDGCPTRFRLLRDDYLASCRRRGNADATVTAKDRAASRFLTYLVEVGVDDLAALGVRDVSGFLLRQRGLRRKTIAAMRSCLADFLGYLAVAGRTPVGLADRLPPHRHVRHESDPHLWTAEEIRRMLAGIDRQSATGKRDYAMILATARLGLRISDLRRLELGDLDWRAKQIRIVQHKTGRPLSLPLLDDVGWAIIDYVRGGRPETACPKVFVKHRHPFDAFGCASSPDREDLGDLVEVVGLLDGGVAAERLDHREALVAGGGRAAPLGFQPVQEPQDAGPVDVGQAQPLGWYALGVVEPGEEQLDRVSVRGDGPGRGRALPGEVIGEELRQPAPGQIRGRCRPRGHDWSWGGAGMT